MTILRKIAGVRPRADADAESVRSARMTHGFLNLFPDHRQIFRIDQIHITFEKAPSGFLRVVTEDSGHGFGHQHTGKFPFVRVQDGNLLRQRFQCRTHLPGKQIFFSFHRLLLVTAYIMILSSLYPYWKEI